MARAISTLVFFAVTLTGGLANAETLSGSEIRANVSGAKFTGTNDYDNPYTYWFKPHGRLKGRLGKKDQFDDRGRWWVRGDRLCMHWELWSMGKAHCYIIDMTGDKISRLKEDGSIVQTSTLER